MSQKFEDGWYLGTDETGSERCRQVRDNEWYYDKNDPNPGMIGFAFTPLRRIATLDGRPVVGKEVIEALAKEMRDEMYSLVDASFSMDWFIAILRKHLCTEKREAGGEEASEAEYAAGNGGFVLATAETSESLDDLRAANEALKARVAELEQSTLHHYRENATGDVWVFLPRSANGSHWGLRLRDGYVTWFNDAEFADDFTPLPEPAERPIVDLPGAFVAWEYSTSDMWTIVPNNDGYTRIRHRDGYAAWGGSRIDKHFSRTPPPTLTPEQEAEAQRLAEFAGKPIDEARRFLAGEAEATCAGG